MDGILFCGIILFFFYNFVLYLLPTLCAISVVVATAKVRIFKQITTGWAGAFLYNGCCCYRKGTNFQANHNMSSAVFNLYSVVVATAKVRIFKQITTVKVVAFFVASCCCYRKGTNFQANHNSLRMERLKSKVVVATAKVRIFKQITTTTAISIVYDLLLLLPQRYEFSSKSQQLAAWLTF